MILWFEPKKKSVSADLAGNNIAAALIGADECWSDVCQLRDYRVSGPIATCEMAFARLGLIYHVFVDTQSPSIAARMIDASQGFVHLAFADQNTDETLRHYGESLSKVAVRRVLFYHQHAFPTSELAAKLGRELGVPGYPAVEAKGLFDAVEIRLRKMLSDVEIS